MISLTECILSSQIRIDFEAGYDAYLHEPEPDSARQAARVEITLQPTASLVRMANIIRSKEGLAPLKPEDYCGDCRKEMPYLFTCDLNEYDPKKVDPFILVGVCDPEADDFSGLYTIDLSQDEQNSIYRIMNRQLKTVGKTCAGLLREAWKKEGKREKYGSADHGGSYGEKGI